MQKYMSFREILADVFSERRAKNPSYSMRAFARDIDILPSRLSDILNGKQGLSESKAQKILGKLNLPEDTKSHFLNLVMASHSRSKSARKIAQKNLQAQTLNPNVSLSEEQFSQIADWHYFAVLELVQIFDHVNDIPQIAEALNIQPAEVEDNINRLKSLGILTLVDKKIIRRDFFVATTNDITSAAIKNYHKQMISRSLAAMNKFEVKMRDFSSVNMLIAPDDLEAAKKVLCDFRRSFMKRFESKNKSSKLYALNLSFFPNQEVQ